MMAAQIHKVKNNIIEILSTEMQMAVIDKKVRLGMHQTAKKLALSYGMQ